MSETHESFHLLIGSSSGVAVVEELKAVDSVYKFDLGFFFGDDYGYAVLSATRKNSHVVDYGMIGALLKGKECKALRDQIDIFADLKFDEKTTKLTKE